MIAQGKASLRATPWVKAKNNASPVRAKETFNVFRCRNDSKSAQERLNFIVIAGHHKQKAFGAILENQPDVQPHPDFKKVPRQLADAQTLMTVRMTEITLQLLQRQPDFPARSFGIIPDARAERPA
jgi:hypothetical protein